MSLFGKGLLGMLLGDSNDDGSTYSTYSSGQSCPMWECRYCGKRHGAYQRPNANKFGGCKNSPYGTHYWDGV